MSVSSEDKKDIKYIVGQNIRTLRKRQNLSQDILADKCGLEKRAIQRAESGEGKSGMSITTLSQIAEGLGTTPDVLLKSPKDSQVHEDAEFMSLLSELSARDKETVMVMLRHLAGKTDRLTT